ncbi:MAG: CopG family transcriptional regulator [Dissulfurispiraceae bacterium]
MKGTSIRLGAEDLAKITKLAFERKVTFADIVREAIRAYGDETDGKQILATLNEIKSGLNNIGPDQALYIVQALDLVARMYLTLMSQIKKSQGEDHVKALAQKTQAMAGNLIKTNTIDYASL